METVIDSRCVLSDEDCERNLHRTLARNLAYCKQSPERTDKLAIVASGPSVTDFLDEIKTYKHIWAINGAYNFLVDNGVIPEGFFGTDPLPGLAAYVDRPNPETTYYISALCDPSVFDALKDQNVKVWFPQQDAVRFPMNLPEGVQVVPGGTTALTRAPFLALMLGFTDVTLYGADSSYRGHFYKERGEDFFAGQRYCYEDNTYPEDSRAPVKTVKIHGQGLFCSEIPLLQQVSQLGVMWTHQTWGVKFKIRCHGLMDAYIKAPLETEDGEIITHFAA